MLIPNNEALMRRNAEIFDVMDYDFRRGGSLANSITDMELDELALLARATGRRLKPMILEGYTFARTLSGEWPMPEGVTHV